STTTTRCLDANQSFAAGYCEVWPYSNRTGTRESESRVRRVEGGVLTRFCCSYTTYEVRSQCTNTSRLTVVTSFSPDLAALASRLHPHLGVRTLILLGFEHSLFSVLNVLDFITFPNLEKLEIVDCFKWNLSVYSHIQRSGCQLTLTLQNTRVGGRELLELLLFLPSLETLEMTGSKQPHNSITNVPSLQLSMFRKGPR
ncbi:hypothetical protein C8R46DRAFT_1286215, partial [Mycena filopes]